MNMTIGCPILGASQPKEPVRITATWVKNKRGNHCRVCSNCGFGLPTEYVGVYIDCNRISDDRETYADLNAEIKYCPLCGARMVNADAN